MRRAANRDLSEPEIIAALRKIGATVEQLDGTNIPDLLVGFRGRNWLMEVKNPEGPKGGASQHGQKLSDGQADWHQAWPGQVAVVRTPEDALWAIGAMRDR